MAARRQRNSGHPDTDAILYKHTVFQRVNYAHLSREDQPRRPAPVPLACFAAGAQHLALYQHRLPGARQPAARRRLANRIDDGPAHAAAWDRRAAPAGAGAVQGAEAADRFPAAAASTSGAGPGRHGRPARIGTVAARRPHCRCTVGGRAGAAQRELWRAAVLAASDPRRKSAAPDPGGAGGRDAVLHDPAARLGAGPVAGAAALGAAPARRRPGGRVREKARSAAR